MLRVSGLIPERFPDYNKFKTLQFHDQLGHITGRNRSQYMKACPGNIGVLCMFCHGESSLHGIDYKGNNPVIIKQNIRPHLYSN